MRTTDGARRRWAVPLAATTMLALAAGCSGGVGSADNEATSEGGARDTGGVAAPLDAARPPEGAPDSERGDASGTGTVGANRPTPQTRAVIRKGEVSLVTKEMNRARVEIDDLLGRHGGYLASEDTSNDRTGQPDRSVLVLRVPEPAFDETMTELTKIGRTKQADRRSEDVTTEVIDVNSRVTTQELSLSRLQRFLRQATDVDDMIRLESEIATRQAELESLKAQQKYLTDNTSMSTITVRLRTPQTPPPPPREEESGFLAGLADGWGALMTVLVGAATVFGAVLPFLVVLGLLGVPTWLLLRAASRRRQQAPITPPPADAG
ncbi:MAG TPA: DUF4349 domain-containing protein [Nocardioidaceae bacterium]|nr:DUF4349 domain-containing protein [Nocardioidaceae bacterium]